MPKSSVSATEVRVPGPAKVLLTAAVIVPGDSAMSAEQLEAFFAGALREGGLYVKWAAAEFVEATDA